MKKDCNSIWETLKKAAGSVVTVEKIKKIAVFLLIAGSFSLGKRVEIQAAETVSPSNCVGHRGCMDYAPDDTLAAFQKAWELGYTQFECDVWYTKSGDFIVYHDTGLKKLTGKEGKAVDLSKENLKEYPIIYGKNADLYPVQYPCTLEETLKLCQKYHLKPWFHLKGRKENYTRQALEKLDKILEENKIGTKPVIFSSNNGVVKNMDSYDWEKGYLITSSAEEKVVKGIQFASDHNCRYFFSPYNSDDPPGEAMMSKAAEKGIKTVFYKVDSLEDTEVLFKAGADICISNRLLWHPEKITGQLTDSFKQLCQDDPLGAGCRLFQIVFIKTSFMQDQIKGFFTGQTG